MKTREIRRSYGGLLFDGILLVSVAFFSFASHWFYGLARPKDQLIAQVVVYAIFLCSFPRLVLKGKFALNPRSIDFWALVSLLIAAMFTLCSSVPFRSLTALSHFFSIFAFYWVVRGLVTTDRRFVFFLWVIFITGVLYSAYGLAQYRGLFGSSFWYDPTQVASRYVNGAHFATFLLFPLFTGMALMVTGKKVISVFILPLFLFLIWCLILTRARTVWIAFAFGIFIFLCGLWRSQSRRQNVYLTLFLIASLGFVLFFNHRGVELIWERFQDVWKKENNFYSIGFRFELWQGCLSAILARPWGWGLGAFSSVFPMFRINDDRFFIDYAHSEPLQIGVDCGVIGMAVFFVFTAHYLFAAGRTIGNAGVDLRKIIFAFSFVCIWIGAMISSLFDFPLRIYALSLLGAMFLALSGYLYEPSLTDDENKCKHRFPLYRTAFLLAVVAATFFTVKHVRGELCFEQARSLERDFDFQDAQAKYEKANAFYPIDPKYLRALGGLYSKMGIMSFNADQRKTMRKKAIEAYLEAEQLNRYIPEVHYELARLYEENGQPEEARESFKKAMKYDPCNGLWVLEWGYFSLRNSYADDAVLAFEKFKQFKFKEYPKSGIAEIVNECCKVVKEYERLKRVIPGEWNWHVLIGMELAKRGAWDEADKAFQSALERARTQLNEKEYGEAALKQVTDFYVSAGRYQEARAICETALRSNPGDAAVRKLLENMNKVPGGISS